VTQAEDQAGVVRVSRLRSESPLPFVQRSQPPPVPPFTGQPAGRARLIGQMTAYLGVRTWAWELELARDEWRGTAVIAHLPGHPVATVLGLAVEPRRR